MLLFTDIMICLINKKGKGKMWRYMQKAKIRISEENLIKCKWTFSPVKSLCLFFSHYSSTRFLHRGMLKEVHFLGISVGQSICELIISKHTVSMNSVRSEWSHYRQEDHESKKKKKKRIVISFDSCKIV